MDRLVQGRSLLASAFLAVLLLAVYAALFDNGALLMPLLGEVAERQNYLHEFFHDGRHVLGVPCH